MNLKRILLAAGLSLSILGAIGCGSGETEEDMGPTKTMGPNEPGPNGQMEAAGGGGGAPDTAGGAGGGGGASTLSTGP